MKKAYCLVIIMFLSTYIAYSQEDKPNLNVKNIIIVFKTHFDNGYTDYAEAVVQKYSSTLIEGALNVLEQSKSLPKEEQFVWTLPAWPLTQILNRCDIKIKPQIVDAVKQGWIAFHSLPFTFETEAGELERMVRYLTFSSKLARQYGLPLPRDAKLTDVPSHSWVLPTLLSNAGVKILHIGCNAASQSPEVPLIFWWEGPDGSKLMTMYWGKYYGTTLIPSEDWQYKTWLAIIHTNDNSGAPTPEEVKKILADAHRLAPNAKVKIGRISDFYDEIMKENPQLPVVRGDMPDTWIHGYASMPKELKGNRTNSVRLSTLESMNSLYRLWTNKNFDITNIVESAYETSGLFDEHTFGMAMSHGQSGYWCYGEEFKLQRAKGIFKPIEDSWKEKADRVYQGERMVIPTLKRQFEEFAQQIKIDGQHVLVFNSLPWQRNGMVTIQAQSGLNSFKAVKDLETGKTIPVFNKGNIIQFYAENIPSLGYRTYIPADSITVADDTELKFSIEGNTIENEFIKISIDPVNGSLVSIQNKKSGKEMVKKDDNYGFGQYLYERFSKEITDKYADVYIKNKPSTWSWAESELGRINLSNDPYKALHGENAKVIYSKNEYSVSATVIFSEDKDLPHDYSLEISLCKFSHLVEINWTINNKPADSWPEGGWITFPFNVSKPTFKLGRLGGIVNPAKDFIKGSNFDYFFVNSGLAVIDDNGEGFGMCSPDAQGISLDRPGLWKYTGSFIPQKPNVFLNLYNNQWSTNFTEWIEGSWSTKLFLWFIDKYDNEKSIITPSQEIRTPLIATIAGSSNGSLPVVNKGANLSMKGVLLTAFTQNPDGSGYVLRLWEQAGNSGKCNISLSQQFNFKSAQPCNLRGEIAGNLIQIVNGVFETEIKSYEPKSFILK